MVEGGEGGGEGLGDFVMWWFKPTYENPTLSRDFRKTWSVSSPFLCSGLWVMAAKFEFEDLKDVSSARVLLQQGLRANPTSKHLWTEVGCGKGGWEGGWEGGWSGVEWVRRMERVGMGGGIG